MARIDFVPFGVNQPLYHPRGSELLFVTKGKLYVGFVTSSVNGNRLFAKVLNEGDAFVFPIGLIRFQGPQPWHSPHLEARERELSPLLMPRLDRSLTLNPWSSLGHS
ncbi:hypothetical protein TIFTF001_001101 [Ficus carica]|uniref:Germin-like protein n=1 Tax=Ficus carica TaxID=3494 RepID=A0AA88CQS0_FICCA|nr:hypothetical protein TIFTF001_001101 [Ficus carica]